MHENDSKDVPLLETMLRSVVLDVDRPEKKKKVETKKNFSFMHEQY